MKRLACLMLALVMVCCAFPAALSEEDDGETTEERYEQWLAEREPLCFKLLEECGLKKEDAYRAECRSGFIPNLIEWDKEEKHFHLILSIPGDQFLDYYWKPDQPEEIWYRICRHTGDFLSADMDIGVFDSDEKEIPGVELSVHPEIQETYIYARFLYATDYEMEHYPPKPFGSWTDFVEKYNQTVQYHYIVASGRIPTKLDITDKGTKVTEGDPYDILEVKIPRRGDKQRSFTITAWLEHGTDKVCRFVLQSPYSLNNEMFPDNERRSAITAINLAFFGWDADTSYANLRLYNCSKDGAFRACFEEYEGDHFLIRIVNDFNNVDFLKAKKKKPDFQWEAPQTYLIEGI